MFGQLVYLCLLLNKFADQNCLVPRVTCLSLVQPREKWFKYFVTRHASTSVPGQNLFEPPVSKIVVDEWFKRLAGSTCWLRDMFAPQLQSTGTRTCQCVHTNASECANVGSNATKVGNKVGSRTLAQACTSLPGQIIYEQT